jgi:transcription antitermination factor NusG
MSNVNKTVKISESDLVNLIDNIVSEAVEIKKKEWLSEQVAKGNKNSILESKLASLEAKVNKLTGGK